MVPVDLKFLVLTAMLNPAVIAVALLMGLSADQWQKLPVAAFAAALAGYGLDWIGAWFGVAGLGTTGRAAAGLFVAQFVFGLIWASLAYGFARGWRS
jgi:hypothetical protein